ncbi:MAG: DUF4920 domain-containing protein [Ignavibacteria bacterium]|nr:DUF4920 domain-containing protein [Ignavibacteria bacterium]
MFNKHLTSLLILVFIFNYIALASGKSYGKKITLKKMTKISHILAEPQKFDGKKVLVEGPIVDVCEHRGCWMEIGSDKEFESIKFKVDDGVIVIPMDAKGKKVRAEGIISVKTTSVEDQIEKGKKHSEKTGEEFDASTIKEPKTIILLKGEGAVIK